MMNNDDTNTTLPYLVLRNGAHITTLCEASDDKGGIERHDALARQNGVLGMVVHAAGSAPSVACFLYGTHDNGHFIELLGQYQHETENRKNITSFGFCMLVFSAVHSATTLQEKWLIRQPESGRPLEMKNHPCLTQ